MKDLYSVKDVATLFGLQEARLRYWAQTGFVTPSVRRGGRFFYTFQDLIGVKVTKDLLDGGLSVQRVRKNLEALRTALPRNERPLSSLKISSDGERVVVVDDDVAFEPASGQLLMSFSVSSLAHQVAEVLTLPRPEVKPDAEVPEVPENAYAAFLEGLDAEDQGDQGRAEVLYRRALKLDPGFAAAWTNLGNVLERRGQIPGAREAYEHALAVDPEQPEARYNLANILADADETELAMAEYRRVAAACPEFADAHFNLAVLCARTGSAAEARSHLERYLALDAESEWAAQARDMLQSL